MAKVFKIIFGAIGGLILLAVFVFGGWYAYKSGGGPSEKPAVVSADTTTTQKVVDAANSALAESKRQLEELTTKLAPVQKTEPTPTSPMPSAKVAEVYGAGAVEGAPCIGQRTGKSGIWKTDPVFNRLGCWIGTEK